MITKSRKTVNGNYIPLEIVTATFYEVTERAVVIDENTALSLAKECLKDREEELLSNAVILSKETKIERDIDKIVITAAYVCEKNVAFEEKILFGTTN